MNKELKILRKSEFDSLFYADWVTAIEYLFELEKKEIWKYFYIKNFEDFVVYKNYISDVEKIFKLMGAYKFLKKMKVSITEIKFMNSEMLSQCAGVLNKKNYRHWLIAMENPKEFELLLEKYQGGIDLSEINFCIRLLNSVIIDFNDLTSDIKKIDYWNKIPLVNKEVFIKVFANNLKKISSIYLSLKDRFEDEK